MPVCPHTCEHVWKNALKNHRTSSTDLLKSKDADVAPMKASIHINKEISNWRKMIAKPSAMKGKATVKK